MDAAGISAAAADGRDGSAVEAVAIVFGDNNPRIPVSGVWPRTTKFSTKSPKNLLKQPQQFGDFR